MVDLLINPDSPQAAVALLQQLDAMSRHIQTRFAGARQLTWRSWGRGPALVMLHGGYGSWRHWARNIGHLAATHTLYIPDLPGLGDSDTAPDQAGPAESAGYILEGLLQLGLTPGELDTVAFSFGAILAGHLSVQAPMRRLILVGPGGLGVTHRNIELERVPDNSSEVQRRVVHRHNLGQLMIADPRAIDALAVEIQTINVGLARFRSRRFARTGTLAEALARGQERRLSAIWGALDVVASDAWDERFALLRVLPGFTGVDLIPGAGHWVAYEAADAFNAVLERHLAS